MTIEFGGGLWFHPLRPLRHLRPLCPLRPLRPLRSLRPLLSACAVSGQKILF